MKHFSISELLVGQEKSNIDFSHPHVLRGGYKNLDLFHSGVIETQEVKEFRDTLLSRISFGTYIGPLLVKESFMDEIGAIFSSYELVIPTDESDSLVLSEEEERERNFLYFLDYLGTTEFYLHDGNHTVVCFEEAELFTSATVQKADTIIFHMRGLGVLIYTKAPFSVPTKHRMTDVAQQLVLMDNFNELYANRYVEEKGLELVGMVAKILYESGVDVVPSKGRSSIIIKYSPNKFLDLNRRGHLSVSSTVTKASGDFYMSLSLGKYIDEGFGPHEAPALASAIFLLLQSKEPQVDVIKTLIKSIEPVKF